MAEGIIKSADIQRLNVPAAIAALMASLLSVGVSSAKARDSGDEQCTEMRTKARRSCFIRFS